MQAIFGLCEPGAVLQDWEVSPMSASLGENHGTPALITGSAGALLATTGVTGTSLGASCGLYLALDADLTNCAELVSLCEAQHGIRPTSLIEMVAGLYLQAGEDCIEKLEGAFALAIWDPRERRLLLAVDRHSFKIVYWSLEDGRLLFASRLSAVRALRKRTEVNPVAVMQYLVHTVVPAPLTIYKDMQRLEPGTRLSYERGQLHSKRYWDMRYHEDPSSSVGDFSQELREQVRRAVHTHLEGYPSDRTGSYLSGGTDSSSVLAFASERYSPFNTFSIYFENRRYDEIGFARFAAAHFNARHHERCLRPGDAVEATLKIADHFEEPFANSSAIGAYYCARLARDNGVDTLLAGDGGDELLAGNERYATDKKFGMYSSVPAILRKGIIKRALEWLPVSGPLSFPTRYIRRAEVPNPLRMLSYNFFLTQDGTDALDAEFAVHAHSTNALHLAQAHYDAAPNATSELNRLLYLDVKMTLSDNDLRKVIGTAELAGVRVRFPLLDRRLAELSGRIPTHLKLKGFTKRYIFKQAMKGILPDRILYKKKHGFGVPVGYWVMSSPEMRDVCGVLDDAETRHRGYFRPEFVSRLKELNKEHPAYFGEVLWLVLMLELWHRRSSTYAASPKALRVGVECAR